MSHGRRLQTCYILYCVKIWIEGFFYTVTVCESPRTDGGQWIGGLIVGPVCLRQLLAVKKILNCSRGKVVKCGDFDLTRKYFSPIMLRELFSLTAYLWSWYVYVKGSEYNTEIFELLMKYCKTYLKLDGTGDETNYFLFILLTYKYFK